jgi:hypothetical protein
MSAIVSCGGRPAISASVTTMAPALMNGLRGMPCSASSWTMELNREPTVRAPPASTGRRPGAAAPASSVNTLEMLWIENGIQASPVSNVSPSDGDHRHAEALAVHPRQRRDVVGHVALAAVRLHLAAHLVDDGLEVELVAHFGLPPLQQPLREVRPAYSGSSSSTPHNRRR